MYLAVCEAVLKRENVEKIFGRQRRQLKQMEIDPTVGQTRRYTYTNFGKCALY